MKNEVYMHLDTLIQRYPQLESIKETIFAAFEQMKACYEKGGKLLVAGNGGSCADAEHIVGELMKGFVLRRHLKGDVCDALKAVDAEIGAQLADHLQGGLPAVALSSHTALNTAFMNDVNGEMAYAQQLCSLGRAGDVFLGITTSGNAVNIQYAAVMAKAKGMKVIGLTGRDGGKLNVLADVNIIVPCQETYQIQELHLPIYHCLCLMLEAYFFED
ncbi:MAG: SIS domain-containing protein [Oscillospiraceae bacterium]|nr:SIS domain-containing protein [Oscillospiraceae bacterium]